MKRPTPNCMDCGQPLEGHYNYCPHCGQENTDRQLGLKTLLGDFISNYFAVDSKLGRSIQHFFFRPGHLTRRFNEGKRVRYIHPLRLYLVISVFFFFILSYLLSAELQDASLQGLKQPSMPKASVVNSHDTANAAETTRINLENNSAANALPAPPKDNNLDMGGNFPEIIDWMKDETLTDEMVMDSLNLAEDTQKSEAFQLFLHQGRKVARKDLDVFIPYMLKNLPVMMFLLLPLFAAYLMFLFRNKPNLYISHIIHALHIHAMAFLLLSLFLLIGWASGAFFFWSIFFLITLYAFLSVKNVYQQGWRRTGFKFLVLGGLYFNTLLVFVLLELTWSFVTF